ncbi:magnesium and cobalt transport protein CorA [Nocardia takedensis]|uniref:magnesium and cobalt transport protein CorA n=1 Tax=Nocardia takedensis TaxID=259390 RepID=UPI0002FEF013|nr:magnesium and cobalt transport protein CorA [Nocardia takedensis]
MTVTTERPAETFAKAALPDCAVFVGGRALPDRFTPADALAEVRRRGEGFVWVWLHDPDAEDMAELATAFGLHPLAVEDVVEAGQRPKLERYDDTLFLVLRTVAYRAEAAHESGAIAQTGELLVFTAPEFVVAVGRGDQSGLRRAPAADADRLRLGPGAALHAIADRVVDTYLEVTAAVERDVDAMEEDVFTPGCDVPITCLYQLKRDVVELRRTVGPLAPALIALGKPETPFPKEVRRYLRDVADHHVQAADRIHDAGESLNSLINAALAQIGVQQNTDMRKISSLAAVAAVPTVFAGIYGMNFEHMPELDQPWGYPLVLGLIAVLCTSLVVVFRRNHWL